MSPAVKIAYIRFENIATNYDNIIILKWFNRQNWVKQYSYARASLESNISNFQRPHLQWILVNFAIWATSF